jgi:hypothetical protein
MGLGFQKLVYCAPFPSPILQLFYDDTLKNLTNTHASIAFFLSFSPLVERTNEHPFGTVTTPFIIEFT